MALIINGVTLPHPDELLVCQLLRYFKVVHYRVIHGDVADMTNPLEYHACLTEATDVMLSIPSLTLSFGSTLFGMYLDLFALWLPFLEDELTDHLSTTALSFLDYTTREGSTRYPVGLEAAFDPAYADINRLRTHMSMKAFYLSLFVRLHETHNVLMVTFAHSGVEGYLNSW
ncbi:hypothetical protein NLJ89_g7675 [Agrocybe chaxingu]|uniref:Uncharacterized protein n=1 Tax=Agrocybe chaxingu TaxID=84603 RepID=A0A9W8MRI8_9AGAR|nr:hypothetical protein NLJ89_g7675 [Agrocybe chaxingu]